MVWCNALTEYYNAQNGTSLECVYFTDSDFTTPIRICDDSPEINYPDPGAQDDPYVKSYANGFRLPISNEWELAARYIDDSDGNGDINVSSGESYPGKFASGADDYYYYTATSDYDGDGDVDQTGDVAWYCENSNYSAQEVGGKNSNALGLFDMSGNAREWCFDWLPDYEGVMRVRRGGSWNYEARNLMIGSVNSSFPYRELYDLGFRAARSGISIE